MERIIKINDDWRFHLGDVVEEKPTAKTIVYATAKTCRKGLGPASSCCKDDPEAWLSDSGWEKIEVPHDYIVKQDFDRNLNWTLGFMDNPNAWYRRHFKFDEEYKEKRVTLYFEGVATKATVYFNGCLLKHSFTGFTPFEVDITDYINFDGDNILAVYVDASEYEGWWYQGAGIYRNVYLKVTDRVCIDLYGVYAKPEKIDENNWKVKFETTVRNENYNGKAKRITAISTIYDANGMQIASAQGSGLVAAKDKNTICYETFVTSPKLWDIDSPNLYTVKTEVVKNGKVCDAEDVRIGFRTAYCDANKGFFLNDKPVKIKGVCVHQDFGLTGLAVPDNIHEYKVKLVKEMGANGFRCSHYMNAAAVMDALDENGIITMAETRWFESSEEGLAQLEALVRRDRNHPSVFFWSIGNEEKNIVREYGRRIFRSMCALVKKLDDQRFVMSSVDAPRDCIIYQDCDVIGVNYNLKYYDELRAKYPDKAFLASEYAAAGTTRGHYFDVDSVQGYVTAYDVDGQYFNSPGRENSWNFFCEHDWIMGGYQWTGLEYRGEAPWPRICSQSGAIDLFMQKKDAFYQNLSHWSDVPMVHVLPHWNFKGMEGEDIKVWVYSNCEEIELFLNGKSLGKNKIDRIAHGSWTVPYESGELKAVGYIDSKVVCDDIQVTTGEPVALKLKLENVNAKCDGDIAVFTCYAVDKNGNAVPDASEYVNFFTNAKGDVVGTGSDISDHNPVWLPSRKMRAGTITIAVKLNKNDIDELKLFAKGDTLGNAVISVKL